MAVVGRSRENRWRRLCLECEIYFLSARTSFSYTISTVIDAGSAPTTAKCFKCGSDNPGTNLFCGKCGAIMDAPQASLTEAIRAVLKQDLRDQKLVEVETIQAIVSRLSKWIKLFAFFVAIPAALLLGTLAIWGVSKFADVNYKLRMAAEKAGKLQDASAGLEQTYNRLRDDASRYEALKMEVDTDSARVSDLEKELKLKVDQANQNSQDIREASSQVTEMKAQVADLKIRIEAAQQLATGTQLGLTSLGTAVANSTSGQPAILEATFLPSPSSGPFPVQLPPHSNVSPFSYVSLSLSGSNFGVAKGAVYIRVMSTGGYQGPLTPSSAPISDADIKVDDASVLEWRDQAVRFVLSDRVMKQITRAIAAPGSGDQGTQEAALPKSMNYWFLIRTSSGESSNWYLISQFLANQP